MSAEEEARGEDDGCVAVGLVGTVEGATMAAEEEELCLVGGEGGELEVATGGVCEEDVDEGGPAFVESVRWEDRDVPTLAVAAAD